jgi:hypothetical protein
MIVLVAMISSATLRLAVQCTLQYAKNIGNMWITMQDISVVKEYEIICTERKPPKAKKKGVLY